MTRGSPKGLQPEGVTVEEGVANPAPCPARGTITRPAKARVTDVAHDSSYLTIEADADRFAIGDAVLVHLTPHGTHRCDMAPGIVIAHSIVRVERSLYAPGRAAWIRRAR